MWFKRKWVKAEGRVLDSRIRRIYHTDGHSGRGGSISLHNYVVEFRTPSGETVRLEVEQHVETVDVPIGDDVPLLVKPDWTEAVFDQDDPRINVMDVAKANKEADEERFRQQLEG